MNQIAENIQQINNRIDAACARAGRPVDSVTLIAVSKTYPAQAVRDAMQSGTRDFGENKAQELVAKADELGGDLRWHFIGNLQRNKVKYVVGRACLIHSVSSLRLAEEIEKEAAKRNMTVKVLAEVNIADEETKHGIDAESAKLLVRQMAELPHLEICGLMAIAPPVDDPEENREHFRRLRILRDELRAEALPRVSMTELSMGMTLDFEVAVEEGATLVRVGTAIFGHRTYPAR